MNNPMVHWEFMVQDPDHSKAFQIVAVLGKTRFTPAWGRNKKDAEQRAAGNALAELQGLEPPYSTLDP